jgi:hypothetical protein
MSDFEDQYLDVIQNIEFAIVTVYHHNPELTDYDVDNVLNVLIRSYRFQQQNREFSRPTMKPLVEQLYEGVNQMCEWRLGREKLVDNRRKSKGPSPTPISLDEIIACLKRIRKSVDLWNKQGGTRGYLQYIDQFVA